MRLALPLWLLGTVACGGHPPVGTFVPETEKPPRRPDGVPAAVEATRWRPVVEAQARGAVTLQEPTGNESVDRVCVDYVRFFLEGDLEGLARLLAREWVPLRSQRAASRADLIADWRVRMRRQDARRAEPPGGLYVQVDALLRWTFPELGLLGAPHRPAGMRPDDLLIRVPLRRTRPSAERFLGDALLMLLRREDGRLKLAGLAGLSGADDADEPVR